MHQVKVTPGCGLANRACSGTPMRSVATEGTSRPRSDVRPGQTLGSVLRRHCAAISLDATAVPQQGPKASAAECKMATVAMIHNPIPKSSARQARPNAPSQRSSALPGLALRRDGIGSAVASPGRPGGAGPADVSQLRFTTSTTSPRVGGSGQAPWKPHALWSSTKVSNEPGCAEVGRDWVEWSACAPYS